MANVFTMAKTINLDAVIEQYGGLQLSKTRKRNTLPCPICGHNGCFSIYVNNKTGEKNYKCFSCGSQGDGIAFVKEVMHLADMGSAAEEICNHWGLIYDQPEPQVADPGYDNYVAVYDKVCSLANLFLRRKFLPESYYFQNRGLSEGTILSYKLGYWPKVLTDKQGNYVNIRDYLLKVFNGSVSIEDLNNTGLFTSNGDLRFNDRFLFPILNTKGHVIAFAGRGLNPNEPKYINSPETAFFKKSQTLFNYNVARKYQTVIVVEGYMDALSLIEAGVPNVVAAMGTAFGDAHLEGLKGKEIILALDNDEAGLSHMAEFILAHRDMFVKVIKLKGFKDFNEALMNKADIKSLLKTMDGPEFFIKYLAHTIDLSTTAGRRELYDKVATLLGSDSDNAWREKYPLNTLYTPFDHSYYWTKCLRLVKGIRTKGGK